MSKNINSKILYLIIILLFISSTFGFFFNSYKLIKNDYSTRMILTYGDCSKEGYGFTKFINDKYKSDFNYLVINGRPDDFTTTQDLFYNKNKAFSDQFKILINYDNELLKNFESFEIIEKKENCYFIKVLND